MSDDPLRITNIADLHYGHPRIDHSLMYQNLCNYFYPKVVESHIVFIAGDLCDTLLNMGSGHTMYLLRFIYDLMAISKKHGTKIRILQGTFSHDRNQASTFEAFVRDKSSCFTGIDETPIDMKVVSKISVEEISDFVHNGISHPDTLKVVYLPDSLPYKKGEEVVDKIKEIYQLVGWSKADLLIGHGTFDFALPPNIPLPPCTYSTDMFEDIVDGQIVMGHIHTHYRSKNVSYTSSFERIAHNEEEPKGYLYLEKHKGDKWRIFFKENKGAVLFKTITPESNDPDEVVSYFIKKVESIFPDLIGYVRVVHHNPEIRSILNKVSATKFPNLIFTTKTTNTDKNTALKTIDDYFQDTSDLIIPTRDNLNELVYTHIKQHPVLSKISHSLNMSDVSIILDSL